MYHVARPMVVKVEKHTCAFHKKHPGRSFPGCTCSSSYMGREKTLEEMTGDEKAQYFAALAGEDVNGNPLW